jgi:outer membrane receptor protein involved in Fe transport
MDFTTIHAGSTTSITVPFVNNITFDNTQFTEELRLTSDYADSPVNFMLGGFYLDAEQNNLVRIPTNVQMGFPLNPILLHVDHKVDIKSLSLFGQLIWDITPKLELAAGARWTDEEREHLQVNLNPANGPGGPSPTLYRRLTLNCHPRRR